MGTVVKLEDITPMLETKPSPARATADGSTLPPLQVVRNRDDDDDDEDEEDERPAQAVKVRSAAIRTSLRAGLPSILVIAVVQLDAVENIPFTLRATLLGADGRPLQTSAGPVCAERVISTEDDSDEDRYRLSIQCDQTGDAWREAFVRVELLDPSGAARSTLPLQSIPMAGR